MAVYDAAASQQAELWRNYTQQIQQRQDALNDPNSLESIQQMMGTLAPLPGRPAGLPALYGMANLTPSTVLQNNQIAQDDLAAVRRYDPNASIVGTQGGPTINFDQSKLPSTGFGSGQTLANVGTGMDTMTALNPNAVRNDPLYGVLANINNLQDRSSKGTWLDVVGPLAVGAFAGFAPGIFGALSGGAVGGAGSGFLGAQTGNWATQLTQKFPQIAQLISGAAGGGATPATPVTSAQNSLTPQQLQLLASLAQQQQSGGGQ